MDKENAAERKIVKNHRWNTFYTILSNGEIDEVIMDVTHTDNKGEKSYSKNRFLFDLIYLVDNNLMTKEQQITQLEYFSEYSDTRKPEYIAVCEYL